MAKTGENLGYCDIEMIQMCTLIHSSTKVHDRTQPLLLLTWPSIKSVLHFFFGYPREELFCKCYQHYHLANYQFLCLLQPITVAENAHRPLK